MATGGSSDIRQDTSYIQVVLLLMKTCPKVLRPLLKKEVSKYGQTLDSFLSSREQSMKTSPGGNMYHTILFPTPNNPINIKFWDVSLLHHILTNQCPNLPSNICAGLAIVKEIRNTTLHTGNVQAESQNSYENKKKIKSLINDVMVYLNDNDLIKQVQTEIKAIENGSFVDEISLYLIPFCRWQQIDSLTAEEMRELRKGLYLIFIFFSFLTSLKLQAVTFMAQQM